ncbi:hypothetical protein M422DRAFT_247543 [Sphaerobolus stellatus SS14]|nr:hypothetical protein M422DRAFT_247543 [Sphaerobolus stellatus SS14]
MLTYAHNPPLPSSTSIFPEPPQTATKEVRNALLASHCKLSDYFYKIDQSPYPIWASLLDPHINYKGLVDDHANEPKLLEQIQQSKSELKAHYIKPTVSSQSLSGSSSGLPPSPEKFNFTAHYLVRQPASDHNELEEYFNQSPEIWERCNLVKWWGARQAQFSNLCHLARDIMTISGCTVAVEHIFFRRP